MTRVGASKVLTGSPAFDNAREPLAQAFKSEGAPDAEAFAVVVNHFKSKSDSSPPQTGAGNDNADKSTARAPSTVTGCVRPRLW